jgi:thiol-disulfide isomerase/thioredoxin
MDKKLLSLLFLILSLFLLSYADVELVGNITRERILENCPSWEDKIASYSPNKDVIEKLKSVDHEVIIEVYLGTWCPDSVRNVSAYFKIMDLIDNSHLITKYVGLPRDKDARKPYIEGKNIIRIPTFIVFINNQEKGRIIENPTQSVEEDLLEIIKR